MNKQYLCIDVGGSTIKYALLNEQLEISRKSEVRTPYQGLELYLNTLEKIYREFEGEAEGIAMSVPGIIDSHRGICVTGGSLTFVQDYPLAAELERRLSLPVSIMNDAKCAALAEVTWGALSDCRDAVVMVFGTGIGGALIKDGTVHLGKHFAAGEFSFITTGSGGEAANMTWAMQNGNERLVSLGARARGVDRRKVTSFDVFRWAEEGDENVRQALDDFTREIARVMINLQAIYDPERFAVGGGISRQPLFLQSIQKNLDYLYRIFPYPVPRAEVVTCKYFNDANLIGALGYFFSRER